MTTTSKKAAAKPRNTSKAPKSGASKRNASAKSRPSKPTAPRTHTTDAVDAPVATASSARMLAKSLARAAMVATGAVLDGGKNPQAAARDTLNYLRTEPETVKSFETAMARVDAWLAHRSQFAATAVGVSSPLIAGGLTSENAIAQAANRAGGYEAQVLARSGATGMKDGVYGIIAALAAGAQSIQSQRPAFDKVLAAHHEVPGATANLTKGLAKAAAAVPGITSAASLTQAVGLGAQLVQTAKLLKNHDVPVGKRAAQLIKSASMLALWLLDNVAKFSAKAA